MIIAERTYKRVKQEKPEKPKPSMSSVRKKVTTLLRDRSTFMAAFGGAMPTEDSHLKNASYGPGGLIREGTAFSHLDDVQFSDLVRSMGELNRALPKLERKDRQAYDMLRLPYLSDPGDPAIIELWRKRQKMEARGRVFTIRYDRAIANHDLAVEILAEELKDKNLYADYPKRSTSTEAQSVERRNDELFDTYQSLRQDGKSKTKAVKEAATLCDYTERRTWQIVGLREA